MRITKAVVFTLSSLVLSSGLYATTQVFFTRGLKDASTYTKNWSDLNNWSATSSPESPYTTTPVGYVPGTTNYADIFVTMGAMSSADGKTANYGNPLKVDGDYTLAGVGQATKGFYWEAVRTLDGSYEETVEGVTSTKYHTLTFTGENTFVSTGLWNSNTVIYSNSGSYDININCNIVYDGINSAKNMAIYNNAYNGFDISVGMLGKTSIISNSANYTFREIQIIAARANKADAGNIYINSWISGYNTTAKTYGNVAMFLKGAIGVDNRENGKIVISGTKTNNASISMGEYAKVELNMSSGAFVNNDNMWFSMSTASYVKQMSGAQLNPTTVFAIRRNSTDEAGTTITDCGTFDMNGFNFAVKNIFVHIAYSGTANSNFEFTFDFGAAGAGVAQTIAVTEGLTVATGTNFYECDWSNSKIYINNFEDDSDKLLFGNQLSSEIQNSLVFLDENGNAREGTVKWRDENGMYSYYLAPVPEPATFAAILGAFATVLAFWRKRK